MLLAGAEFRQWLAGRRPSNEEDGPLRVLVGREGDYLRITLARPLRGNAFDARMRDELLEALALARTDTDLRVKIGAQGASFCTGGDLDEFGRAGDPSQAHLIRISASVGRLICELRDRIDVELHGHCIGAGIELPAFAGHVSADPGSQFLLPEIQMGLIPGAGGTVSIPRRIGRWRTAYLAFSADAIGAELALEYGLIDSIAPRP
jgi:enoyl-CoA hydratase/carnithine racemase